MDTFAIALLSGYTLAIPQEFDWFAPLVGDWDFRYYDRRKEGSPTITGQWLFRRILRGTSVEDILISPGIDALDGAEETNGAYAASIRMFNPKENCYDVTYSSRARTLTMRFFKEGNKLVGTAGNNPNEKWVFSDIREASFQWSKVTVLSSGAWRTECSIYATRKRT